MRQTLLILPILLAANCTDPAATGNETSVIDAAEGVEAEAGTAATDASPSPTPTGPASNMTMENSAQALRCTTRGRSLRRLLGTGRSPQ